MLTNDKYEEQKRFYDKLYRWSVTLSLLIVVSGVGIGVHQVFIVSNRVDERSAETQKSLGCIAKFFTITDRAKLTVSDLEKCTLTRP